MKNEIIFRLKITLLFHELEEYIYIYNRMITIVENCKSFPIRSDSIELNFGPTKTNTNERCYVRDKDNIPFHMF